MKIEIKPAVIAGEEFYTITQAASVLKMTYPLVYKYITAGSSFGKLPSVNILNRILINKKDVEKLLNEKEKGVKLWQD